MLKLQIAKAFSMCVINFNLRTLILTFFALCLSPKGRPWHNATLCLRYWHSTLVIIFLLSILVRAGLRTRSILIRVQSISSSPSSEIFFEYGLGWQKFVWLVLRFLYLIICHHKINDAIKYRNNFRTFKNFVVFNILLKVKYKFMNSSKIFFFDNFFKFLLNEFEH